MPAAAWQSESCLEHTSQELLKLPATAALMVTSTVAPAKPPQGAMMVPLTRDHVKHAVSEYGFAWTEQDPDRIARLFSEDAIYVERVFDKNGTMRGRDSIREYWEKQICGKQSSIKFRHVDSEMVTNSTQKIQIHPSLTCPLTFSINTQGSGYRNACRRRQMASRIR